MHSTTHLHRPGAALFAASATAALVNIGLQAGGLAGAGGTLAAVITLITLAVAQTAFAMFYFHRWIRVPKANLLLPFAAIVSAYLFQFLAAAALQFWLGERDAGSFETDRFAPTPDWIDYYTSAYNCFSLIGYGGYLKPASNAARVLFTLQSALAWFTSAGLTLVAVLTHRKHATVTHPHY